MRKQWQNPNRRLDRNREARFKSRTGRLPLEGRVDGVLFAGAVLGLVGMGLLLFLIFQVMALLGFRDEILLQPLADERKLVNVRDELATVDITAAAWHEEDGRIYIGRETGKIHRYDPVTKLWSSETPFEEDSGISSG